MTLASGLSCLTSLSIKSGNKWEVVLSGVGIRFRAHGRRSDGVRQGELPGLDRRLFAGRVSVERRSKAQVGRRRYSASFSVHTH